LTPTESASLRSRTEKAGINLRFFGETAVSVSLDETSLSNEGLISAVIELFGKGPGNVVNDPFSWQTPDALRRTSAYLTHPVFNTHHTETEMLRYMRRLESKDLSLTTSMIPLGSCTMKLNATSEMLPVTWENIGGLHPFVPIEQAKGYGVIFQQLEQWLAEITGFHSVSLQPNAGSQGEYAGLLVIRAYHRSRGDLNRIVCLIPVSAHGTNPASAAMAGREIVGVACDAEGNVDVEDLRVKIEANRERQNASVVYGDHPFLQLDLIEDKRVCQNESVARGDYPFLQLDFIEENRTCQNESVARGDHPFLQSDLIERTRERNNESVACGDHPFLQLDFIEHTRKRQKKGVAKGTCNLLMENRSAES
jgi:hypothetical protein